VIVINIVKIFGTDTVPVCPYFTTTITSMSYRRNNRIGDANIQYFLSKEIGRGQYGYVFKARAVDQFRVNRVVAIKKKSREGDCEAFSEVCVHAKLRHPNIVDLYHVFSDQLHYYLAMEYCENGSLADLLKRSGPLELSNVRDIGIQIFGGTKYIHSQSFVHRDIKAENVLIDARGNVKIADFGLAAWILPGLSRGCGTWAYAAPEVIINDGIGCGASADIWSVGVLL
jgi:serine/threonine protein kinase